MGARVRCGGVDVPLVLPGADLAVLGQCINDPLAEGESLVGDGPLRVPLAGLTLCSVVS